jgi:hypothetical protein
VGVRIDEVPITPEKVLAALDDRYRRPQMPEVSYPETVHVAPLERAAPATAADADPSLRP